MAFKAVHLQLHEFVDSLCLGGLPAVDSQDDKCDDHQEEGSASEAGNSLRTKREMPVPFVPQHSEGIALVLADVNHDEGQQLGGGHAPLIGWGRLVDGRHAHHLGFGQGGHVAGRGANGDANVRFISSQVNIVPFYYQGIALVQLHALNEGEKGGVSNIGDLRPNFGEVFAKVAY